MLKREDEKKEKKNWGAIIAILLFISVLVPVAIFTLSVEDTGDSAYTGTYAEILQKHEELGLKSGDTVIIEDFLSGIWYNATTGYTYIQFQSGDELRASPADYEAGYPNHNALDRFRTGDHVRVTASMEQEMGPLGIPRIVGRITSMEMVE